MFSFFKRTPIIDVDCYTWHGAIYHFTPIVYTSKCKPNWINKVKKTECKYHDTGNEIKLESDQTLRTCYGFLELYKRGVFIENWSDFVVNVDEKSYRYYYSCGKGIGNHPEKQYSPGFKNYHIIKLRSPWLFHTKEDVQFLMTGATWHLEDYDFKVMPGILNFYYQSQTNIFLAIKKQTHDFTIKIGQPLAQIIPLSEKVIRIHNHLVTENEWTTLDRGGHCTLGWRRTIPLSKRNLLRNKN